MKKTACYFALIFLFLFTTLVMCACHEEQTEQDMNKIIKTVEKRFQIELPTSLEVLESTIDKETCAVKIHIPTTDVDPFRNSLSDNYIAREPLTKELEVMGGSIDWWDIDPQAVSYHYQKLESRTMFFNLIVKKTVTSDIVFVKGKNTTFVYLRQDL